MKKNNSELDDLANNIDKAMKPEIVALRLELKKLKINPLEEIPPPQAVLKILSKHNNEERIVGTLDNFSVITGKAKSRKSFLINLMVSAACRITSKGIIIGSLPRDKKRVLYFDTEQGKYHVQFALKRICKQLGIANPENLDVYTLRSKSPQERQKLIEAAIESHDDIGLVVIDGIKDLITSINDEEQASMISSKLLKWTEEKNIHIMVVLHQNKSDNNARGHIGSELINKAETVLSVTKEANNLEISVVQPQQCRNKEPDSFAFEIIGEIPSILEDFTIENKTNKSTKIENMMELDIYRLVENIYLNDLGFTYSQLVVQMKVAFKELQNEDIGNNKSKELIKICKEKGWLLQEAQKGPYTLGKYRGDNTIIF